MTEETIVIDYTTPFPLLPLRDVVVFPHMVIPLFVGRKKSILALEQAMENGKQIALVAQHDAALEEPSVDQIYAVGVLANILQMLKLPDGTVKVLVEGKQRIHLQKVYEEECFLTMAAPLNTIDVEQGESDVALRTLISEFESYGKINSKVAPEALGQLKEVTDLDRLVDTVAGFIDLKLDDKQFLLEADDLTERRSS